MGSFWVLIGFVFFVKCLFARGLLGSFRNLRSEEQTEGAGVAAGGTLVFKDPGFGEQAMTAAIPGGAEFTQGCFRATQLAPLVREDAMRSSELILTSVWVMGFRKTRFLALNV
jgi:hypothetical protein